MKNLKTCHTSLLEGLVGFLTAVDKVMEWATRDFMKDSGASGLGGQSFTRATGHPTYDDVMVRYDRYICAWESLMLRSGFCREPSCKGILMN